MNVVMTTDDITSMKAAEKEIERLVALTAADSGSELAVELRSTLYHISWAIQLAEEGEVIV
jgi:hypothetical protein